MGGVINLSDIGDSWVSIREDLSSLWPFQVNDTVSPQWSLLCVVAVTAVVMWSPTFRAVRYLVTLVHEWGHATMSVMLGSGMTRITLHRGSSGLTQYESMGSLRRTLVLLSGYTAPPLLGLALSVLMSAGLIHASVCLIALILITSMLRMRNALGMLVSLISVAGFGAMMWYHMESIAQFVILPIAALMIVGGVRTCRGHRMGVIRGGDPESDSGQLSRVTRIPSSVISTGFLAFSIMTAALSVYLIIIQPVAETL